MGKPVRILRLIQTNRRYHMIRTCPYLVALRLWLTAVLRQREVLGVLRLEQARTLDSFRHSMLEHLVKCEKCSNQGQSRCKQHNISSRKESRKQPAMRTGQVLAQQQHNHQHFQEHISTSLSHRLPYQLSDPTSRKLTTEEAPSTRVGRMEDLQGFQS